MADTPRIALIVPNYPDAVLIEETLRSVREAEAVQVIVVDDASPTPGTRERLAELQAEGLIDVLILQDDNSGPARAINEALGSVTAQYVHLLANDDLLCPGALAALADALDSDPGASFAVGSFERFGDTTGTYVPPPWDPWRLLHASRWPASYTARIEALRAIGGLQTNCMFEDWDTYLAFAGAGHRGLVVDRVIYRYRVQGTGRLWATARRTYARQYAALRAAHAPLFAREPELRRASPAPWTEKLLARPLTSFRVHRPVAVTEFVNRAGDAVRRLRG